jgi:ubiquinone/menaquinone biosynthesis C-methylase UbiE
MRPFEEDKRRERDRYEQRARHLLDSVGELPLGADGAESQPLTIRRPYIVYEDFIRRSVRPGGAALDVCCGTGLYSLVAARAGAVVTASDIAEHNLVIARKRAARVGFALQTAVADAENLPFRDQSFDLITCAGSLSYVDVDRFFGEVKRLLRPDGWFVCVDSLNHNPIYRLNRFLQYLRGRRTRSTLLRMPTLATISRLTAELSECEVSFHGAATFLAPIVRPLLGEQRAASLLDRSDRLKTLDRFAFKFVLRGRHN